MPRHRRLDIPGAVHHVIVRGLERRKIFNDDHDYAQFLSRFESSLKRTGASCFAWALMPNHLHLLVRTGRYSLSELMCGVLTGYAVYFNKKNKRHGYLYQNRYKSILCQEDSYLLKLTAYIHLNPLRAKIVKDLNELASYKWCGHGAMLGKAECPWQDTEYVLALFGNDLARARKGYLEFVRSEIGKVPSGEYSSGGLRKSSGGWEGVEELKRNKEYWRGDERLLGDSSFVDEVLKISDEMIERKELIKKRGWTLDKVISCVSGVFGVKEADITLKGRGDHKSMAKAAICHIARRELGLSGAEIGLKLGITKQAVSKRAMIGEAVVKEKGIDLLSL